MIFLSLSEVQSRTKLQQILDHNRKRFVNYKENNLAGDRGDGFVNFHISRMYEEFGGKWDEHRATEYINSVAAENDFGNITLQFENVKVIGY